MRVGHWGIRVGVVVVLIGVLKQYYGWGLGSWDREVVVQMLRDKSDRLGIWAMPAYVGLHTLTLALCLPYAVFFEAGASLLFGFFPAVLCVFSAKILGASLSFGIGRFYSNLLQLSLLMSFHQSICFSFLMPKLTSNKFWVS